MRFCVLGWLCLCCYGQPTTINPKVQKIVSEISEDRIKATLTKLESFGTRNSLSSKVDAPRTWIADELKSYSPRLQVSFDRYKIKKVARISRDAELVNIIAVLPGTFNRDRQVLVSAHYDSMVMSTPTGSTGAIKPLDPESRAPGVNDDGSGTAAVMELARVMSQYEFEKTVVFVLFVAEEQGLIGSTLMAEKAAREKRQIEAVLNNDIIGSVISGNGEVDNHTVRVFSDDPSDSASRQVARYIKDIGERYVPSMNIDLIFRPDRFGRGGDHTPFNQAGFAGVRFSSAEEDYSHQHTATDTLANMDVPYTTRVARINAAVASTLAWAPRPPVNMDIPPPRPGGSTPEELRPTRPAAMISRGKSRYDAVLRWKTDGAETDLAGYVVLMRATTDAYWQRRIFVGKATEYQLPGVGLDSWIFGVQAVDQEGNPSLVSPYALSVRSKQQIEVVE